LFTYALNKESKFQIVLFLTLSDGKYNFQILKYAINSLDILA